jgi:tyrosinase
MSDVYASPSDPTFWMHHAFVDHSWALWQSLDTSVRTTTIDGVDHNGNPFTVNTVLTMGGIRPDVPVSSIINTLGGVSIGGVPFCFKYDY